MSPASGFGVHRTDLPDFGMLPGPWVHDAACRDTDSPDAWHPTDSNEAEIAYAKSVCRQCPVRRPCLEFALSVPPRDAQGIWSGTTEKERLQMWRARAATKRLRRTA